MILLHLETEDWIYASPLSWQIKQKVEDAASINQQLEMLQKVSLQNWKSVLNFSYALCSSTWYAFFRLEITLNLFFFVDSLF